MRRMKHDVSFRYKLRRGQIYRDGILRKQHASVTESASITRREPMKVAILGGPANQTKQLELWLKSGGHQPEFFKTGNAFFNALRRSGYDLLMVDVALPDLSGIDLIAWARHHFEWHVPVIAMTAREAWHLAGDALKAGADDYLLRPVREAEIQSRINTVTLRQAQQPGDVIEIGDYSIDTKSTRIILNGEPINLTRKEFELAAYFFRHPDQLISHDTLLGRIWKLQSDIDTRTVATHVSRIRKKLRLDGSHGCEILSLYGYGYRCLIDRPAEAPAAAANDRAFAPPAAETGVPPIELSQAASHPDAPAAGGPLATPAMSAAETDAMAGAAETWRDGVRPVDRYVANLLKERQDFEEQIRRLRDAFCEATLELRALKRQGPRRHHEIAALADYSEDLA
ncbi:response regulator transcription factor [Burkholderia glumae]|nr:response regulator transcription factor [Burkholderia glumae]